MEREGEKKRKRKKESEIEGGRKHHTRFLGERVQSLSVRSLGSSLTGVVCAAHERAQPVLCAVAAWGPRDTVPCRR